MSVALSVDQADDEQTIRRELLGVMLAQNRTALAGNVAIGLTTAAVLLGSGVGEGVAPWLAAIALLVLVRARYARELAPRLATLDAAGLAAAERHLTQLIAASGLAWGVLPWLSYHGNNAFVDFFSVAMLVGMTAGAVSSSAALPRAMQCYVLAAFVPFIVKSALIGGLVYLAGGLTIVFSIFVMFAFSRSSHRALRNTLVVTRQNARLAEALRRERDAVQATMRAKDLFLAGVTHDLRQPVHALGLYLRYLRSLRSDELSPQAVEALCAPMDTAMRAMSGQLSRLLELSRLEAGEARVSLRGIDVAEVFQAVEAQFGATAREKGLRLRLRAAAAGPLHSDPKMLQSIVDNLVSNALRYTDAGGVLLAARRCAGALRLDVFDTGPGIAAELIPQLFIAYRRFDDRKSRHDEGQGLGLALVRKQADLLGHVLQVRSVPGRGSLFSLTVPLLAQP